MEAERRNAAQQRLQQQQQHLRVTDIDALHVPKTNRRSSCVIEMAYCGHACWEHDPYTRTVKTYA